MYCFRNQPEICELLLSKGANIDAVNNGGCSTLHVAVNKQQIKCVKTLLRHRCNVNTQVGPASFPHAPVPCLLPYVLPFTSACMKY